MFIIVDCTVHNVLIDDIWLTMTSWHGNLHHLIIWIARTAIREMEAVEAGLLRVHIKKDGLVEHPIVMIVAIELYFKVVHSRLIKIY